MSETKRSITLERLQSLVNKVKALIPTKVSDLTDDSGHYTKPANGIPAADLAETYVKPTDYATTSTAGVVKVCSSNYYTGVTIDNGGAVIIRPAKYAEIKAGTEARVPIVPGSQNVATFYGLAKAAGDTTQSLSDNAIGTYTSDALDAIHAMLDIKPGVEVVRLI